MKELMISINSSKRAKMSLKIISHISSLACAFVFCLQVALSAVDKEYITAINVAASAAIGLLAVTVMRKIINAPRPYEVFDFYEIPPREKSGQSFPSRHAYSAFAIATLAWLLHPIISLVLLLFGVCLSLARVLLGIHFVRDVIVGAAIGIISGVLGILIIVL